MLLKTCPFLLGCPTCWQIIVHSILLWFFVFLQYQLLFLLFHFLFCLFGSSLFSSWLAWPEVYWFCLPFQKASSLFYWFFLMCFISILFIYSLIFVISFLVLTLIFVCSSFSKKVVGGRLSCLFNSLLTHWFFSSMLFSLHVIIFFSFLFLWFISSFMPLWSE